MPRPITRRELLALVPLLVLPHLASAAPEGWTLGGIRRSIDAQFGD